MVWGRQIAVLLLAACLTGCGGYAMFDPESTASFTSSGKSFGQSANGEPTLQNASTSDKTDTSTLNSLFARASQGKLNEAPSPPQPVSPAKPAVVADATSDTAVPAEHAPPPAEKIATEPRGRAYLYRGVAGLIYSRGMDGLADRIKHTGIPASVSTYLLWRDDIDQAIRDYRRDPQPITIIGHSMGGDAALAFAERLNQENIPVSLLVTYDPTRIADDVPPNVERYINIFQSSNFMGGGNVVQGSRFHGHYASFNLKDHSELVHINIEKAERIQTQLVTKIAQLSGTPATGEGDAVPLHLEVPADAAIELWDSGLPVQAHAGDTLKTMAAAYHVPVWALGQANSFSANASLTEGQRVVVPRHLVPMPTPSTLTSYAPVGH